MRSWVSVILIVAAFAGGWFASGQMPIHTMSDLDNTSGSETGKKEPLYWVAPMDPDYQRDAPGKSPMGMDLVPVYEDSSGGPDDGGVTIAPSVISNLGVRQAEVTRGPLAKPISTVGYVTYDEDRLMHIHSRVAGWVEVLNIKAAGDPVKKGETLFEIYSPELALAQEEYLQARRTGQPAMERGARRKLQSLGISSEQVDQLFERGTSKETLAIKAPVGGHVAELGIRQGMYIRPDTQVMAIGTLDSVWVLGEFFERQAGLIDEGNDVSITVAAFPGQEWEGSVDYLYPQLNQDSRTMQARVRILNSPGNETLRPNMFVNLALQAPLGEDLISIPKEALIRGGRGDRVILAEGDGRFRPVPVKTGTEAGDRVVVLEGLEAGQQVVTSAQFLIDSESNLDAAFARLSPAEEAEEAEGENQPIPSTGRLLDKDPEEHTVTLNHEPIPALGWPSMEMDFELSADVDMEGLEVGSEVRFELLENTEGDLEIISIQPVNPEN
ncbi:efflux RND transporter periplasmic adaptor subunit [Marinobacter sp.]|uniref:efflux RND transporter periplasmic adaptor subunit n=1 Tax=Marinobacter sp. TaxID=50741 RepID=UPI00384E7080